MKKYGIILALIVACAVGAGGYYYYMVRPGTLTIAKNVEVAQQVRSPEVLPVKKSATSSEISLSPLSICRALDEVVEFLKISPEQIMPINQEQKDFLGIDYAIYRQHMKKDLFAPDELKAYVARDAETLNKILKENGFSIQLEKFASDASIGIVSIQNILVKWLEKAARSNLQSGGTTYPSFYLDAGTMRVSFLASKSDPHIVIAEIDTLSKDKVYCAVKVKADGEKQVAVPFFGDKNIPDDHTVAQAIDLLRKKVKFVLTPAITELHAADEYEIAHQYNAIELPMISYKTEPSLKWILRLQVPMHEVRQALQEVIFKMNEFGAQAKAAVAMEFGFTGLPSFDKGPLVVDQPFLLWIERPGMPLPIFAAYLHQKYWEDPGSLGE